MVQIILVEANIFLAIKLLPDVILQVILYVASILRRKNFEIEIEIGSKILLKRNIQPASQQ